MASLIDELIEVLDRENDEYEMLLNLSKEKTGKIIENNLTELQYIVAQEQGHVEKLNQLEQKREEVVKSIAVVLNKDVNILTVKHIVELLKGQKTEQRKLSIVHDKLRSTLNDMVVVNDMNQSLIKESLEMLEFNMNLMNNIYQGPEVANYSKDAYNVEMGGSAGFDTKQ